MSEEVNILEIEAEVKALHSKIQELLPELTFHQKGFSFSAIRPVSAKELLGDNWKGILDGRVDAEELFKHSQKDGLKPIDVMLSAIYSDGKHRIQKGNKVNVIVSSGDVRYSGTHTALAVDAGNIVIPVIKVGDAKGVYQNVKKIDSINQKIGSFEQRIAELKERLNPVVVSAEEEPQTVTEHLEEIVSNLQNVKEKKRKTFARTSVTILCALAVTGAIVLFLIPESKKETV